jgi:hypothetical protein
MNLSLHWGIRNSYTVIQNEFVFVGEPGYGLEGRGLIAGKGSLGTSTYNGYQGIFLERKSGRSMKLTTQFHLVPRSRAAEL